MEKRHTWGSAILSLSPTFIRNIYSGMINEQQCLVLYSLADSMAHFAKHWWLNVFYDETMSSSAAKFGMELFKALNKGLELIQICAQKICPAVVWTILNGVAQFHEIVEDARRYSQMLNRLIQRHLSSSSQNPGKKQQLAQQLRHKVEFDCRVLQTRLEWAYEQDKVILLQTLKPQESSGILPNILRSFWAERSLFHDSLTSCLISILETGLPLNIDSTNLYPREYLGCGAFGRVSKTQWCKLPVAIKEFPSEPCFLREFDLFKKFLAMGYSSHIVGIIGCSENKSVVLELMDKDLIRLIEERRTADSSPFSLNDSIDIMLQIAEGMRHLHHMDVTYRDLKPSNVLVQIREDQSFVVKLADFGISKHNFETAEENTSNRGTRIYMAPEMMKEGGNYSRKVDVHSYGMVCFEILTGKQPYLDAELVMKGERPLLPEDIPISLDKLIQRCWNEDANARPSFEEICDKLWLIKENLLLQDLTEETDPAAEITELKFTMTGLSCLKIECASTVEAERKVHGNDHEKIGHNVVIDGPVVLDKTSVSDDASLVLRSETPYLSPKSYRSNLETMQVTRNSTSQFPRIVLHGNSKGKSRVLKWLKFGRFGRNQETNVQDWKAKLEEIGIKEFKFKALTIATKNFSQKLGEGGFGSVYFGHMADHIEVAVKVLRKGSYVEEFEDELLLGRLRHKNLVGLKGWCQERDVLILVHDYMQNDSLERHLFKDKFLPWSQRYEIVKGVAEGLEFLHFGWEHRIVHRDIKPSNVLLDAQMVAHLGDFGFARNFDDHDDTGCSTKIVGTVGYLAPEYAMRGRLTYKADIYSFGMLLLVVACGRHPCDISSHGTFYLLEYVLEAQESGNLLKVVDPRLGSQYDKEEMTCVLSLGLSCIASDPHSRPDTKRCRKILNGEDSLP